jgi:glycosyltransferase involved in cell wall biosynthesis
MSLGVAKRDYNTLIKSLSDLPEYNTELFMSSKFGDKLKSSIEVKIPRWVSFPGYVSEDELIRRYQNCRFVVVPLKSTTHTSAGINIVFEAAAFGKAVIATNTGGMASYIKNDETGILVPPNNSEAMRDAIQRLWENPEIAYEMGIANRHHIEKHYNPEVVNARISELVMMVHKEYSSTT